MVPHPGGPQLLTAWNGDPWNQEKFRIVRAREPPNTHTGIQVYRYTGIQACRYRGIQVYRYTGTQVYRYTGVQVYGCTGIQVYRCTGKYKTCILVH